VEWLPGEVMWCGFWPCGAPCSGT